MKTAMWLIASAALAIVSAGCNAQDTGLVPVCSRVPSDTEEPETPAKPAPAHPDFARLLSHRNYYTIQHVGAYEPHFAVWFSCIVPSVDYYAVSPDGVLREAGGASGGTAIRKGEPSPVPAALREAAELVRERHEDAYKHASPGKVEYLGTYREVVVDEVVPTSGPGDPYARMIGHATVTLRANADLSSVSGMASMSGGQTRMCSRDSMVRDCGDPRWIDFTPSTGGGLVQLPALVQPNSPQPTEERERFAAAVLSAARGFVAGKPGAPLNALLARQGSSLLPPGFAPPITVSFQVIARSSGGGVKQEEAMLSVSLPTLDVLRGGARANATTRLVGLNLRAEVDITPAPPAAPAARAAEGKLHPRLRLRYRLTDGRGNLRQAEIPLTGEALIEGDAVLLELSALPEAMTSRPHDPPLGQHFPGVGPYSGLDTYVGISSKYEVWWR